MKILLTKMNVTMENLFTSYVAQEDDNGLRPEQLAELSEFFSHKEYENEGGEFLNDAIRTVDQVLNLDEEMSGY